MGGAGGRRLAAPTGFLFLKFYPRVFWLGRLQEQLLFLCGRFWKARTALPQASLCIVSRTRARGRAGVECGCTRGSRWCIWGLGLLALRSPSWLPSLGSGCPAEGGRGGVGVATSSLRQTLVLGKERSLGLWQGPWNEPWPRPRLIAELISATE